MRVLFSSSPGLGHLFPMIPLAWALRTGGHDVLVASTGDVVERAVQAGLPAVEAAPGLDMMKFFGTTVRENERFGDFASIHELFVEDPRRATELVARVFGALGDRLTDGMLAAAQGWRPDLVVFGQMDSAGPFIAAKLGIPAVQHNFGSARGTDELALYAKYTDAYDRHGVTRPTEADAIIDIATEGLGTPQIGWPMRYVAYNAGGVLPGWLLAQRERPRVCVTLGTAVGLMSVGALGQIVGTMLAVGFGSLTAGPHLGSLVTDFDMRNRAHLALLAINLFSLWQFAVVSLGISRLTGRSFGRVALVVFAVWILYKGLAAWLRLIQFAA